MKLSPFPIIFIGIAIAIIALSYGFFHHFVPNRQEAALWKEYGEKLQLEAGKRSKAVERVEKANRMVVAKANEWVDIVNRRTPPSSLAAGGIDLSVNAWQLTVDAPKFRNSMQRALNAQLRKGGVKVVTAPFIPEPSNQATSILANYFNYPALKFPAVMYYFGPITVEGTYEQISNHLKAYSSMPNYLAQTDGLSLSGTSPNLRGTYNLAIIGLIRGNEIFPPVPEGGAAPAQNAPGQLPPGMLPMLDPAMFGGAPVPGAEAP